MVLMPNISSVFLMSKSVTRILGDEIGDGLVGPRGGSAEMRRLRLEPFELPELNFMLVVAHHVGAGNAESPRHRKIGQPRHLGAVLGQPSPTIKRHLRSDLRFAF